MKEHTHSWVCSPLPCEVTDECVAEALGEWCGAVWGQSEEEDGQNRDIVQNELFSSGGLQLVDTEEE